MKKQMTVYGELAVSMAATAFNKAANFHPKHSKFWISRPLWFAFRRAGMPHSKHSSLAVNTVVPFVVIRSTRSSPLQPKPLQCRL